jgi:hypothetical protein
MKFLHKMNRKRVLITLLSVVAILLLFSSDTTIPPHLALARKLQANVLSENNSYRHRPSTVEIEGLDGAAQYVCHTDCSGLVGELFHYAYGYTQKELHHWLRRPTGHSLSFFEAVSHDRGFTRIQRIQDIRPGDILTYKLPPGSKNHGHVMIVNEAPEEVDRSPSHLLKWKVPIIDCTGKGHGTTDSRYLGDGLYHSGIGKGNFCLFSDQEGNIMGCAWSTSPNAKFYSIQNRPFVVGRLISGYQS